MADEVWVLGATGRIGRAVAGRLVGSDVTPVLVGRDQGRLDQLAAELAAAPRTPAGGSDAAPDGGEPRTVVGGSPGEGVAAAGGGGEFGGEWRGVGPGAPGDVVAGGGAPGTVVAGALEEVAVEIARQRPAVVVNTVGPFTRTAVTIARACLPGSHYLDLANDLDAMRALLGLHEDAAAAGRTLVTGAGFGVLGTEAVVARLCQDRPTPSHVRVDALASIEMREDDTMGEPLAATVVDVLAIGGRRYVDGRLVRTRLGGDVQRLTLPDGQTARTAGMPSGDLHAARLVSGAPSVTATNAEAPTGAVMRAVLPLAGALLSVPALRRFAVRRLARVRVEASPRPRTHSWGHAVVTWPDGTTGEAWLRAGEGMDYTAAVAAETAARLARGEARPGALTPAGAFGPELAVAAGGEFVE